MPYDELLGWINYFERRPVGWREDDRTYKLMRVQGTEQKATEVFPSLVAVFERPNIVIQDGMLQSDFKGTSIFSKMLAAKGGDVINL